MQNNTLKAKTRHSASHIRRLSITLSLVFILFLLTLSQATYAMSATQNQVSPPSIEWQQSYGSTISQAIQTSDGGFALTGSIPLNPSFIGDPWLIKTDSQGNVQWKQSYYTKNPDLNLATSGPLIQARDGGYVLGGGLSNPSYTAYLLKTDSHGNIQWIKTYPSKEYIGDLIKTPDGGYAISGAYQNGTGCWLAKVDSNGVVQWSRDYEGVFIYRIVQANDGGYALIGEVYISNGQNDATLIKTDSEGKMVWNQTYQIYGSSIQLLRIAQTSDKGYVLAGSTYRTNSSQGAVLLIKTDSFGKVIWNQTYSQLGEEVAWSIAVAKANDGGYTLGCGNNFDGNLVKVDAFGNLQWNISFSSENYSISNVNSVILLSDGSYAFTSGDNLIKTNIDIAFPSEAPTQTAPEFNTPILLLASILIATVVAALIFKHSSKNNQSSN
jgi:hypothetical protein